MSTPTMDILERAKSALAGFLLRRTAQPSCSWANCFGKRVPAVAEIHIEWACGHSDQPTPACDDCLHILHDGVADPHFSPCPDCGEWNLARITAIEDLDQSSLVSH